MNDVELYDLNAVTFLLRAYGIDAENAVSVRVVRNEDGGKTLYIRRQIIGTDRFDTERRVMSRQTLEALKWVPT